MKIVVIGGAGRIGAHLVARLAAAGHDVVAASRRTGVDTVTGRGLASAVRNADAVVDASRPPNLIDDEVLDFFVRSTDHQLTAEADADVALHVALSVVGARAMARAGSAFMRAKTAQEQLIESSGRPFTIVAATQFFEFFPSIADHATTDGVVRLPPVHNQPIAAGEVAETLARIAVEPPRNGTVELGGPERLRLADFVATGLAARADPREVVVDDAARYFGARLDDDTLVPGGGAELAATRFGEWLKAAR